MASYYLELLQNPLSFPPVSRDINVFFDECNKQVFAVAEENNFTRVHVKGPQPSLNADFQLENKGHVISIKFSPNQRILATQRSAKAIDFANFLDGTPASEYSQTCKGRATQIIGFCWTSVTDVVFVTNQGIEFYQTQSQPAEKSSLKLLKQYHVAVNWFVFLPESSVLLLSSGIGGNIIHPYLFKPGNIVRLPKFEVENPSSTRTPQPSSLLERDVTVANIYNNIYVVVLRNHSRSFNTVGAEVVLYQLQKDAPAKKTAVLRLGTVGRFAVNVVDNLIVVHHQASKTSMLFDINMSGDFDGQVTHYYPVLAPLPIQPFTMMSKQPSCTSITEVSCESYSPNWVVFQPKIIIDAKLGCLWQLNVKLDSITNMIEDKGKLIDFLLLRSNSKSVILSVCNQVLQPGRQSGMGTISQIFDKINTVYAEYLELDKTGTAQVQDTAKENDLTGSWFQKQSIIEQTNMYTDVFLPFVEKEQISYKFMIAVLLEYIRSLNHLKIPVEYYLNEFIINLLVQRDKFYQLHQFIQYHVLSDSKPLACLLLSLENVYPPAYHLALDMMKRLGTADEEIVETLISKQQIIAALKYLQSTDAIDSAAPRKFLSAALKTGDTCVFYTVFTYFQERNLRLRKSVNFAKGEQCEKYEKAFKKMFGNTSKTSKTNLEDLVDGIDHVVF